MAQLIMFRLRHELSSHLHIDIFDHVIAPHFNLHKLLLKSIKKGNVNLVKYLMSIGVSIHRRKPYVFDIDSVFDNEAMVEYLKSINAKIEIYDVEYEWNKVEDDEKKQLLAYAAPQNPITLSRPYKLEFKLFSEPVTPPH